MTLSTCFAHPGNCRSHSPAFVSVRYCSTAAVIGREPLWLPLATETPDIHSNVISRRRLADIKRRPQARLEGDYIIHCGRDLVTVPIKDFVRRTAQLEPVPLDKP